MNFQPQPHPLFFAHLGSGHAVETGRVIGWAVPDDDSSHLQPVALYDHPAGGVTEPRYLNLEEEAHFLAESREAATSALDNARHQMHPRSTSRMEKS